MVIQLDVGCDIPVVYVSQVIGIHDFMQSKLPIMRSLSHTIHNFIM